MVTQELIQATEANLSSFKNVQMNFSSTEYLAIYCLVILENEIFKSAPKGGR